jgi:phenylacetate-CoA ligase
LSLAELERGLDEVPVYAGWRARDPGPASSLDARYAALPATTKDSMLASAPRGFVPASADLDAALAAGDAELVRTSGTTGPPVTLVWSQAWWDASERASWALNAEIAAVATGRDPEAVLASPRCVGPGEADRPLTAEERTLGRLLFPNEHADVARWTDATVRRMARELAAHAPTFLEAEPAYLAAFCARADALAIELPRPRVVTLTYTNPSRLERARIQRVLGVAIASSYGSTETGTVLVECERGRMHHNAASCRIELEPLRGSTEVGRLLVTPFGHPFACYLRFDIGDLARRATTPCPCGRPGGAIQRIEGRVAEATIASDGRVVTVAELDDAVAAVPASASVVSYQVEQRGDGVRLRATTTGALDGEPLAAALRALYGGSVPVAIETVAALEPEPSGKYARVRQRLALDHAAWFEPRHPG